MQRPAIPAEIRRAVLVEAGHRCAIPTCRYPSSDLHHIIPWETCKAHDFDNLIALCPNCHRRADSGEIDRKSLRLYKSQLSAALGTDSANLDVKSNTLTEIAHGFPGYEFEIQLPEFAEDQLQPVITTLTSWANSLLFEHRSDHCLSPPFDPSILRGPNTTSASYEFVRNDSAILSIKYQVNRYFSGAVHGSGQTVTWTFVRRPLFLLSLRCLFEAPDFLEHLSRQSRAILLENSNRDEAWVHRGTEPVATSFRAFNISPHGLLLTFDEYQVDCYAAGPQIVEIPAAGIVDLIHQKLRSLWETG